MLLVSSSGPRYKAASQPIHAITAPIHALQARWRRSHTLKTFPSAKLCRTFKSIRMVAVDDPSRNAGGAAGWQQIVCTPRVAAPRHARQALPPPLQFTVVCHS